MDVSCFVCERGQCVRVWQLVDKSKPGSKDSSPDFNLLRVRLSCSAEKKQAIECILGNRQVVSYCWFTNLATDGWKHDFLEPSLNWYAIDCNDSGTGFWAKQDPTNDKQEAGEYVSVSDVWQLQLCTFCYNLWVCSPKIEAIIELAPRLNPDYLGEAWTTMTAEFGFVPLETYRD